MDQKLTLLPSGFSVFPRYGGGRSFLVHIVFNAVPLNRFDSNLVHLSKKVTISLGENGCLVLML